MRPITLLAPALAAAMFIHSGCSKNKTDDTADIFKRQVAPERLPLPSCDDTADDGRFEAWNADEEWLLAYARTVIRPAGTYTPGYMSNVRIEDRRIDLRDGRFRWRAQIDTPASFAVCFMLVDRSSGSIQALADANFGTATDTVGRSRAFASVLAGKTMTPGCKRLYYLGYTAAASSPLRVSSGQVPIDSLFIRFRGHFDVEIY